MGGWISSVFSRYARWENFTIAISRAMESCKSQNNNVAYHFRDLTKMIGLENGVKRKVKDYVPFRFVTCYLVAQKSEGP